MSGPQVRALARRMLDRAQLLQAEAISARGGGAKKAAIFLEAMAVGLRADGLQLARAFPAANDGSPPEGSQGGGEDPPFGPDEPTPDLPPRAA